MSWDLAYHEAGHAVAAILCGVAVTEVVVDEDHGWVNGDPEHVADTSPANLAFIAWAGSWTEARFWSDDPWSVLPEVQEETSRSDMAVVNAYWADPGNAPHETDEQWASAIDWAWSCVETFASSLWSEE